MFLSAFRSCHFLPANSSVSANRAHRSPPSCGSASLRARPLVQAAVPQKGPRHHEQQLHLQHVPPSASGHKVWISQQQNYSQSWWEMSFLPRLQGETSTLQEEQTLTRFFCVCFTTVYGKPILPASSTSASPVPFYQAGRGTKANGDDVTDKGVKGGESGDGKILPPPSVDNIPRPLSPTKLTPVGR